jgi:hypothetical protein
MVSTPGLLGSVATPHLCFYIEKEALEVHKGTNMAGLNNALLIKISSGPVVAKDLDC